MHAKHAIAVMLFGSAGVGVFLALQPACTLPDGVCQGETISALTTPDGSPNAACAECLQSGCCELVGDCTKENSPCGSRVRAAHECILQRGPGSREACAAEFLGPDAGTLERKTLGCMFDKCGEENSVDAACRVSNCAIDPAARQFVTPSCDRCFTSSCCAEINECYRDRPCKLAMDCILDNCADSVSLAMRCASRTTRIKEAREDICRGRPPSPESGANLFGPGARGDECILGCILRYGSNATVLPPEEIRSRCLAISVYLCGANAGCADQCVIPTDASDTECTP